MIFSKQFLALDFVYLFFQFFSTLVENDFGRVFQLLFRVEIWRCNEGVTWRPVSRFQHDMGFTVPFNKEHKGGKEGGMVEHLRIYLGL
jgi:hypothetical protein